MGSGNSRKQRRFATKQQRDAVLIAQDFRCAICSLELKDGFELDHRLPYALGGVTDVSNLQAVCKSCHRLKTASERAGHLQQE